MEQILALRLDISPEDPRALKLLTADNEIAHLAEIDDRMFTELLKEIKDLDTDGLFGTGYDEQMLSALLMTTRTSSEIRDSNEAAQWVGMPEFGEAERIPTLVMKFRNEEDRAEFVKKNSLQTTYKGSIWTSWWPKKDREDLASVRFVG